MAFLIPLAAAAGTAATAGGTLATIGTIASVAGTAISAFGQIKQGKAAAASANYNAAISEQNANLSRQNAKWAAEQGHRDVHTQQMKNRAESGALLANQAASGVDVSGGSAVDVRSSAAELGQLNTLSVRTNAARRAYGYMTDAAGLDAQAALDRSSAKSSETAGMIGAGATLLGGLGDAASNYSNYLDRRSISSGSDGTGPGLGGIY